MTEKEIAETLNNLKLKRIGERSKKGKIISGWMMTMMSNVNEIDLGDANAYIKTNYRRDLTEDKEEALHSVEAFLKRYFLQKQELMKKLINKSLEESKKINF
jgi:hypothetical protein